MPPPWRGTAAALAPTLTDLLLAAGPADRALDALWRPPICREAARVLATRLADDGRRHPRPRARPAADHRSRWSFAASAIETGVSVTIYAPGRHEELGRGGRYICGEAEPATGLTLYPDAVLRAAARRARPARACFVPAGADPDRRRALARG